MDPHNEPLGPLTGISEPETHQQPEPRATQYPLYLFAGLIIATSSVYGLLTLNAQQQVVPQAQTAAVVEALPSPYDSLTLEAQSAFIVDLTENKIVHSKNADVQLPLASITKVMLALAVGDVLTPDATVTISEGAVFRGEENGSSLRNMMVAGEVWRAKDLIDYTLVLSSNVGAEALAEAANEPIRARYPLAPEENATIWRMNMIAKELGLSKTYFLNPTGLDVSPTQAGAMGSARDATILLAYAYKTMPDIFSVTNQPSISVGPKEGPIKVVENTNHIIAQIGDLKMGKTGLTDLAGGNLGVVFTSPTNRTFAATVLGSSKAGRFMDILAITDAANR